MLADASHKSIQARSQLLIKGSMITCGNMSITNCYHIHLDSGVGVARWVANRSSECSEVGIVGKWDCKHKVVYCFRPAL